VQERSRKTFLSLNALFRNDGGGGVFFSFSPRCEWIQMVFAAARENARGSEERALIAGSTAKEPEAFQSEK